MNNLLFTEISERYVGSLDVKAGRGYIHQLTITFFRPTFSSMNRVEHTLQTSVSSHSSSSPMRPLLVAATRGGWHQNS